MNSSAADLDTICRMPVPNRVQTLFFLGEAPGPAGPLATGPEVVGGRSEVDEGLGAGGGAERPRKKNKCQVTLADVG